MGRAANPDELKCLLSLADRLRELAPDTLCRGDQTLYLLAAEALEKHGTSLAEALPEPHVLPGDSRLYRHVDVTI